MDNAHWHNPEYRAWVCEQIGVEYKGLPLTHPQKQRFLFLSQKSNLQYPGNLNHKDNKIMPPTSPHILNTAAAENALLSQYDRELAAIDEKKTRYTKLLKALADENKAVIKKRTAVAKALGVPTT